MLLEKPAYDFAQRLLKVFNKTTNIETENNNNTKNPSINKIEILKQSPLLNNPDFLPSSSTPIDQKRIIGSTNYKKFEDIAKELEKEDELLQLKKKKKDEEDNEKKELLKMGCNNDLRKERQLMDKPVKDKIEASKIFKKEGDDFLHKKNYLDAINSYEKGLLQLFYTFSDDNKEEEEAEKIKENINLNCSYCLINLKEFDKAIGYLNEALRNNKENLKTLYRISYCYFNINKFEDAKRVINDAYRVCDKNGMDKSLFVGLEIDIKNKIKEIEKNEDELYKKIAINSKS